MNVSVILAHPSPGSFNHAIAATVCETLAAARHTAWFHDLQAEGFDPVLPAREIPRDAILPNLVAQHIDEIVRANAIVIVHPNYWSRPPALLCGWTDRVLRAGRAYEFVPDGQGGARSVGLLKAHMALVFNTANTPQEIEETQLGDPLEVHWRKVVFRLCGVTSVHRRNFAPVITSLPEQRAAWLAEVRDITRSRLASPSC